ncbi:hypothetical protein EYF80_059670 [Liparis tanakae]|uniref:Uncharacterized protein n=1 Tax=Liparis tanakae TaxID=230148 RepID=A0A4Z2EN47_9TELE|nr:hypothetical protein EYF80_059670 [Liparis tanakae]
MWFLSVPYEYLPGGPDSSEGSGEDLGQEAPTECDCEPGQPGFAGFAGPKVLHQDPQPKPRVTGRLEMFNLYSSQNLVEEVL